MERTPCQAQHAYTALSRHNDLQLLHEFILDLNPYASISTSMSVGFGFSAGDFIAAVNLIGTVIDALRDSGDASSEYRSLISQLYTLESALLKVKRLELDDSQHAELIALRQAAAQCQNTIDQFWEKIKKYQPSLRAGGSGSRVRDGWRKVKWAVCKKEDVVRFKADLMAHTESIELLLTTVQMAATRIGEKKNEDCHRSLVGRVQDSYFGCMQRMTVILETVSTGIRQGRQLLEMTAKVIQTNVQIFQIVLNIQSVITQIPGQIERQQPVYFIDALGRHTPFHLEFITSAETLILVLKNNFRNIGTGATKIEKGEFAVQDSVTKHDINLESAWEAVFRPGQKVAMSMVFNSAKATNMYCPTCREDNGDDFAEDEDIECRKCKMVYRRSISWTTPEPLPSFSMTTAQTTPVSEADFMDLDVSRVEGASKGKAKRKKPHDEDEEMALFRRVRIKTSIVLPTASSRPGSPVNLEVESNNKPSYRLFCEWSIVGCKAEFSAQECDEWIEHSAAHIGDLVWTLKFRCPICFEGFSRTHDNGTAPSVKDVPYHFSQRMHHIKAHLDNGEAIPADALPRSSNPALTSLPEVQYPTIEMDEEEPKPIKRQRHFNFDEWASTVTNFQGNFDYEESGSNKSGKEHAGSSECEDLDFGVDGRYLYQYSEHQKESPSRLEPPFRSTTAERTKSPPHNDAESHRHTDGTREESRNSGGIIHSAELQSRLRSKQRSARSMVGRSSDPSPERAERPSLQFEAKPKERLIRFMAGGTSDSSDEDSASGNHASYASSTRTRLSEDAKSLANDSSREEAMSEMDVPPPKLEEYRSRVRQLGSVRLSEPGGQVGPGIFAEEARRYAPTLLALFLVLMLSLLVLRLKKLISKRDNSLLHHQSL